MSPVFLIRIDAGGHHEVRRVIPEPGRAGWRLTGSTRPCTWT